MSRSARVLETLTSGVLVALLAPLIAAAIITLRLVGWPQSGADRVDPSVTSLLLLALGVASAAYFLGGIPAFAAGLVLPTLRRKLPTIVAALVAGCVAVAVYLATFGSHLLGLSDPIAAVLPNTVPAFLGATAAAYLFARKH